MPSASNIQIKIGADPELFLVNKKGEYISAHGLIPGTKEKPFPVDYGAIQVDGVAAEFNIDPATNSNQFAQNISNVMKSLQARVPDLQLKIIPATTFPEPYWSNIPTDARVLGCNPDFNAWDGQVNPPPNGDTTRMRTAAGHIHLGWTSGADINDEDHFEDCQRVVQQLDYYIGMYSLLWDTDTRRRNLYGKAGAFRPKHYGCEYRVPSNMWLKSVDLQMWIFDAAYSAVYNLITGERPALVEKFGNKAQEIINGNQIDFVKSKEFKSALHAFTGLPWPQW